MAADRRVLNCLNLESPRPGVLDLDDGTSYPVIFGAEGIGITRETYGPFA